MKAASALGVPVLALLLGGIVFSAALSAITRAYTNQRHTQLALAEQLAATARSREALKDFEGRMEAVQQYALVRAPKSGTRASVPI